MPTPSGASVRFYDADDGYAYLRASQYDAVFSQLDYELRMKERFATKEAASEAFWASERTLDWSARERKAMGGIAESALEKVADFAPCALPDTLRLIKGAKGQEFGAYHTVDAAVVMPASEIGPTLITANVGPVRKSIESTLLHEIFHVYSRLNPAQRDALYALLGFRRNDSVVLPDWFAARRVTNPDAHLGYVTTIRDASGEPFEAALVTYSEYEQYDGYKGLASRMAVILGYLEAGFVPVDSAGSEQVHAVDEVDGYLERIGDLTDYTMAVDEVLADGFERLVKAGGASALADDVTPEALRLLEGIERTVSATECGIG